MGEDSTHLQELKYARDAYRSEFNKAVEVGAFEWGLYS